MTYKPLRQQQVKLHAGGLFDPKNDLVCVLMRLMDSLMVCHHTCSQVTDGLVMHLQSFFYTSLKTFNTFKDVIFYASQLLKLKLGFKDHFSQQS